MSEPNGSTTIEVPQPAVKLPDSVQMLSPSAADLLKRLLEINPQYRLRSLLNLRGIAFFKRFSFDDVRKLKIEPITLIESSLNEPFINENVSFDDLQETFKSFDTDCKQMTETR